MRQIVNRASSISSYTMMFIAICLMLSSNVWASQMGYSFYVFQDNQDNQVTTSSMNLTADLGERTQLNFDVELDQVEIAPIVDGVSGATRPSIQKEETFRKNRGQLILGVAQQITSDWSTDVKYYHSEEQDYQSKSGAGQMAWSFAQNNARLKVRGQYIYDKVGNIQEARPYEDYLKETWIAGLSFSQDLNSKTVLSVGADLQYLQGFLSDPYRTVDTRDGNTLQEVHPDLRYRQAAWIEAKRYLEMVEAALIVDYRYYWDLWGEAQRWGVTADTYHARLNKSINTSWVLSLDYRFHQQQKAYFWKQTYTGNETYRSSDYKLSTFDSQNFGWALAWNMADWSSNHSWAELFGQATVSFEHFYYVNSLDFYGNVVQSTINFDF